MLTLRWLLRRLAWALFAAFLLTAGMLFYLRLQDNGLSLLVWPDASEADIARAAAAFGGDRSIWAQYPMFLRGLLDGVLGRSFVYNEPAMRLVLGRMPATLELVLFSMSSGLLIGLPLGRVAMRHPRWLLSRMVTAFSLLGISLPVFWLGLMLSLLFAVHLGVLPAGGRGETLVLGGVAWSFLTRDGLAHLVLPLATLTIRTLALVLRLARQPTVLPALKGSFLELGNLIAGAVVIENIFAWPGIGKLTIDSVNVLDRPVIVAVLVLVVSIVFALNTIEGLLERLFGVTDTSVAVPPSIGANLLAVLGGLGLLLLVGLAMAAAQIAMQNPYDPTGLNIANASLPPHSVSADGAIYWLGTDDQGRDITSAILYGMRISLLIGAGSVLIALLLGGVLGALAAVAGGVTEAVIGWVGIVQLALPPIFPALVLLAFTSRRISYVVLALVLIQWPRHALIAHQAVQGRADSVWWRSMLKLFAALALAQLATAISLEATLSFLGLGLPNTMPSLGVLIANGSEELLNGRPWSSFWPGLALVGLVITSNLVAWRFEAARKG